MTWEPFISGVCEVGECERCKLRDCECVCHKRDA